MSDAESVFGPVAKWGRLEFPLPEYRAPEHGRAELVALILDALPGAQLDYPRDVAADAADIILAAGWRHQ